MNVLMSIVLGAVQGLTEFLPISSSGHLVIIPWLFGWKDMGLAYDAALHLGTLLAILTFFFWDWVKIIKEYNKPLLWLIILGSIPAGLAGLKFESLFETVFRSPLLIGGLMLAMGLVLLLAERMGSRKREMSSISLWDSIVIGVSQCLALMPGVSRSGITITSGLFLGLDRRSAARFSFLLSTPIILAAGLMKTKYLLHSAHSGEQLLVLFAGIVTSSVVGFFAIKYMLRFLEKHSYYIFVWYRIVVGLAVMLIWGLRGGI